MNSMETSSLCGPDLEAILSYSPKELADVRPSSPVRFEFRHENLTYHALVSKVAESIRLRLIAEISNIAYSSEDLSNRRSLQLFADHRVNLDFGRFLINKNQRLVYQVETIMGDVIDGAQIVAAATQLLLKSRPYIIGARNADVFLNQIADDHS